MASQGAPFNRDEFFAEVFDGVNGLQAEGFSKFEQNVSKLLDESEQPKFHEVVEAICLKVQTAIDESLQKWQEYCEEHCFQEPLSTAPLKEIQARPEPEPVDAAHVTQLDAELVSLRNQIVKARQEKLNLQRECVALEASLDAKREKANVVAQAATQLNHSLPLIQELGQASARLQEKIQEVAKLGNVNDT